MNIYQRLRQSIRVFRNLGLNDPKAWNPSLWNLYGAISSSGENVTESSALTYSAVWNAVELISSTIAALPLNLMQGRGKTERIADDYRLHRVMHNQWNPFMTAKRGRECQIAHVLTWGNGYAEKVMNGYGEVIELWPIPPHRVEPRLEDGAIVYEIKMDAGPSITLPRSKVLHIMGPSYDGFTGYSRISMARKSIGLGMAMETFGCNYFSEGIHPSGIVYHPQMKDVTPFKKAFSEVYNGLSKQQRVLFMEESGKFEKLSINPEDSQFLESRQFQIPEVARWFNVPPHKLKDLTRSSFNNIESEDASFLRDRILPDLVSLEQEYDMQLLNESDRSMSGRGKLYFKHNVKGILRADTAARTAFYQAMLDRGVFSINEVRELEDMEPVDGGNIRLVPLNMQRLEDAGKPKSAPVAPEPPALPAPGKGNGKDKEPLQLMQ